MTEPTPVADLDAGLDHMIRSGRRVLPTALIFLACVVVILGLAVSYLLVNARGERKRTDRIVHRNTANLCVFFRDIGITDVPAQSTEFFVQIVVDSRNIFIDLDCVPGLPAPSRGIKDLAAKYHLHLEG